MEVLAAVVNNNRNRMEAVHSYEENLVRIHLFRNDLEDHVSKTVASKH